MFTRNKLRFPALCAIVLCITFWVKLLCQETADQKPVINTESPGREIAPEASPETKSTEAIQGPEQVNPESTQDQAQANSSSAQEQATEQPEAKSSEITSSSPQAKTDKQIFTSINTKLKQVSIARAGASPLLVGINEEGAVQYDGTTWKPLDKKDLKQIEIAGDGTIWGIDNKNQAWRKDEKKWTLLTGSQLDYLSIGNKNEVWGIFKSTAYRKVDPTGSIPSWRPIPSQVLDIAVGGDGAVWVIGAQDTTLYRLHRPSARWERIIKPSNEGLGVAKKIRVADQFNVAFLDFLGKIWKLVPGKKGHASSDWRMISDQVFTDFSLACDGTIIGITPQAETLRYDPSEKENKELEKARGQEVQADDIVTLTSLWDGRQVWTQGSSFYDPQGTNAAPNNHLELLVGPTNNAGQFVGGFFTLALAGAGQTQEKEIIKFGDEVEIYSRYAAPGLPKKSGLLGKEWKWWVHNPHAQLGKDWCDLAVSLLKYPGTQQGAQIFKIISPYGMTGTVRENDAVQLVSSSQKRNVFVRQQNRLGDDIYELVVPSSKTVDSAATAKEVFGSGENSGAHLFNIKPAIASKVPKTAQLAYQQVVGKPIEPTGKQKSMKKKLLKAKMGNGIGIVSQISNFTAYPLETSAGAVKAGTIKFLRSTGVQGLAYQQLVRVASPSLLGSTLEKAFWLSGTAQEIIVNNFESGTLVKLKKLWSKGIAWINESLGTPGSTTVMFFARANDEGNIQVCFGEKISTKDIFRVIIGGWKNSKAALVVGDTIVAQVTAEMNPFAKAYPGQVLPYWVSMHKNFVVVGAGTPGTNIFLASYVPYTTQPSRIGFSSHEQPVDYTEIIVGNPFTLQSSGDVYKQSPEVLRTVAQQGSITWAATPLRAFNTGTISFQTTAPHTVTLVFDNNQQGQYGIELGANNNKTAHIVKNGETVHSVNLDMLPFAKLSKDKPTTFWASIDNGRIIVGQGNIGSNAFMLWEDPSPLADVARVGFVGTTFVQEITNLVQAPPVTFQELKPKFEYTRQVRPVRQFKGPMILVKPFEYQLVQDGARVVFKDMNDETSSLVPVISTPQRDGRYPFVITLAVNGKPEIKGLSPTDAPAKFLLETSAQIMSIAADQAFNYAPLIGQAAKVTDFIAAVPLIGEAGVVVKNIAAVAATTALASAGIAAKTAAASAKALAEHGFRAHDSYVLIKEAQAAQSGGSQIPTLAVRNEAAVGQLLLDAEELKPNIRQDFELLLTQYQEILRRINHPYVVKKLTTKTSLATGLSKLSSAYKSYSTELALQFMSLLLSAVTNPYLKTMPEVAQWSRTMSEILRDRFLKNPDMPLQLPALNGEYLWLPFEFTKPDQGGISFEVKARSDVFVCFAQDQFTSKSVNNQLYEILLGGWNNSRHEIHIQSLGRATAAIDKEKNSQSMLSSQNFVQYSVTLNDGVIKVAQGENTILEWKDPFPWTGIRTIGLSSWDTPITVRSLQLLTDQGVVAQDTLAKEKARAQAVKDGRTFTEDIKDWQKDMKYRPIMPTNLDQYYRAPQGALPMIVLPPSLSEPIGPLPPLKQKTSK